MLLKSTSKLGASGLSVYKQNKKRGFHLRGPLNAYTGYGLHASYTVRALLALGYGVESDPLEGRDESCFEDVKKTIDVPRTLDGDRLLIAPVKTPIEGSEWFFTMHETTQLPQAALENVCKAQAVIVPSNWCQQCFNAQGVDVPVFVVPIGVNNALFCPARSKPSTCVFGSAGNLTLSIPERKNLDLLLLAFREAFRSEKNVKLRIKVRPECQLAPVDDSRIEIIREQFSEEKLADWFRSLTAYVSPSRAEAFGQMNVQAMSCAVPVICCAFGGVTDYHSDAYGYSVDYALVRPVSTYYDTGLWAEPDMDSLIIQMRRVYENKTESERRGSAARVAVADYAWNTVTRQLERVLSMNGFWDVSKKIPRSVRSVKIYSPVPAPAITVPAPVVFVPFEKGVRLKSFWKDEPESKSSKFPAWLCRRTAGYETVFYMSGDLGDIIYALPTIRALKGGQLRIGPARDNSYYWVREPMTVERYRVLAPLLELQKSYLSKVVWSPDVDGWHCHVDLNDSRRLHREPYYVIERNLVDVVARFFGCGPDLWRRRWLVVDTPNSVARFVFTRSPRYQNPDFPWKQIVEKHGSQAVFMGVPSEHAAFVAQFGPVSYYPTEDFLELARVLAGAEWLVANQSAPLAVGEGLKMKVLHERFAESANCDFNRDGHVTDPAYILDLC